ncbi:hypothetical protein M9Y10_013447 [Tritrichomonas musculus]|uniref:Uncharacterized protein n=1 Tax=Tritrichomonas musculus TaxID=1915356 RepID=A0ABR2I764_9EUKA
MINNEAYLKTSAEVCTQIASYFDIVDNCIAMSDTNKQYTINPQTSYSPSPHIPQGSYTSVIISPNTNNTADLYNGFIKADMEVNIGMKGDGLGYLTSDNYDFDHVWFGFKDARDAIEKYEIVANGITIYTQNFGCEESFLTACCSNETTKRADVYSKSRHKDVWNFDGCNRCGFTFHWGADVADGKGPTETGPQMIHLKIDLRRFLPLSNIKYLPAFAGKIELRLFFSCAGMVCCPLGPEKTLKNSLNKLVKYDLSDITNEFVPLGEEVKLWSSIATAEGVNTVKWTTKTFHVNSYETTDCQSIVPCFGIDTRIYNGLVQRYSDPSHPLTFPTQTISVYTTTNKLTQTNDKSTITITPRFVDSIFCLFPLKHTHKTIFKNPLFNSFQLNCGSYGNIPAKPFGTDGNSPEFIEYCQNAMNMNGEQSGFNKEVIASLANTKRYHDNAGNYSNDRTSFFIGLPTETDNTYQQGLTSLSPINFEINISQKKDNDDDYANIVDCAPLLCLLYDSSISILVQPNGMPPMVRIGTYDITSPE